MKPAAFLGIIPARGGSKGVPRKNVRCLAGQPLIHYTLQAAGASRALARYVVSTEDEEIAAIARAQGCPVVLRPAHLAADDAPMVPVMVHALEECRRNGEGYDYAVLLQPTTPLRTAQDIDACAEMAAASGADAVVSVCKVPGHYHPDWQFIIRRERLELHNGAPIERIKPRRQALSETYTRNGAVYVVRTALLLDRRVLFGPQTLAYVMPERRSVNIDSETDFAFAEHLLSAKT